MSNRILTNDEVRELIYKPMIKPLQDYFESILATMQPGERRIVRNPFGKDLADIEISKPVVSVEVR